MEQIKGKIHSYQSLGAVDGPGLRFMIFLQGCPLRCAYCHNPDTWEAGDFEKQLTPQQVLEEVKRYKSYFGSQGGITVSGGEPLLQPEFVRDLFALCHAEGIHTALDTSGCITSKKTGDVLTYTDLVLLDIKMTNESDYLMYTGCKLQWALNFLQQAQEKGVLVWVRQVIVPSINDTEKNILQLRQLLQNFSCVQRVQLLPFKKLCMEKYQRLKIPFPLENIPAADEKAVSRLQQFYQSLL